MAYDALLVPTALEGGHGWHWEPFSADPATDLPMWLADFVTNGLVFPPNPRRDRDASPLPPGAPEGVAICRCDTDLGLAGVLDLRGGAASLATLSPHIGTGVQTTAVVTEIRTLCDGFEAVTGVAWQQLHALGASRHWPPDQRGGPLPSP